MTIYWSLFAPGLLLLLFPADRLLSSLVQLRSFDCFQSLENSSRFRPWWWVPSLWLDPVRSFAGTWLLQRAFGVETNTWLEVSKPGYVGVVAILGVGVLGQMFTRRADKGVLLAPMGYVAGILVALTSWPVSILGLVSAVLGLFACRQFHGFFSFGAAGVALIGFVLRSDPLWIAPAAGAFALPIIAGFLTSSTLEVPTRSASPASPAKIA